MNKVIKVSRKYEEQKPEIQKLRDEERRAREKRKETTKDIDRVMADQVDLVEVEHTLHQVLNYKGT